jgi:hypothetical protein
MRGELEKAASLDVNPYTPILNKAAICQVIFGGQAKPMKTCIKGLS